MKFLLLAVTNYSVWPLFCLLLRKDNGSCRKSAQRSGNTVLRALTRLVERTRYFEFRFFGHLPLCLCSVSCYIISDDISSTDPERSSRAF
jgi:hypothetical protein